MMPGGTSLREKGTDRGERHAGSCPGCHGGRHRRRQGTGLSEQNCDFWAGGGCGEKALRAEELAVPRERRAPGPLWRVSRSGGGRSPAPYVTRRGLEGAGPGGGRGQEVLGAKSVASGPTRRKPGRGGGAAALSHIGSTRSLLPGAEVTAARDGRPQLPAAPRDRRAAESRSGAGRGWAGSPGPGPGAAGTGHPRPEGLRRRAARPAPPLPRGGRCRGPARPWAVGLRALLGALRSTAGSGPARSRGPGGAGWPAVRGVRTRAPRPAPARHSGEEAEFESRRRVQPSPSSALCRWRPSSAARSHTQSE